MNYQQYRRKVEIAIKWLKTLGFSDDPKSSIEEEAKLILVSLKSKQELTEELSSIYKEIQKLNARLESVEREIAKRLNKSS